MKMRPCRALKETSPEDRKRLFVYLGREISEDQIHWEFIRQAMMSVADLAIMPVEDVLGLGEEARRNRPSTMEGNWAWRLKADQLTPAVGKKLSGMARIYARA